ncbi:MAG TPA: hypothetical protein VK395_07070 [Gemmataceae bacterium]|nr:hypothetical protein [Gemmataceae bacterium]
MDYIRDFLTIAGLLGVIAAIPGLLRKIKKWKEARRLEKFIREDPNHGIGIGRDDEVTR